MQKDIKPKVVKIKGNERYQRLLVPEKDTVNIKSGCITLEPGESVGEHSTGKKEEAIVILQGQAEIFCGGRIVEAQERAVVYMPPEIKHNVKNIGQELLKYVFIVVPV